MIPWASSKLGWSLECRRLVDTVDGGTRDRCQTVLGEHTEATDLCYQADSMQEIFDRFGCLLEPGPGFCRRRDLGLRDGLGRYAGG